MNNIFFAGPASEAEAKNANRKYYEIIHCPTGGKIVSGEDELETGGDGFFLVPALKKIIPTFSSDAVSVLIEQAVFANRDVVALSGPKEELAYALDRAVIWYTGKAYGYKAVLDGLGSLLSAYVAAYIGEKKLSPVVGEIVATIEKNIGESSFSLDDYIRSFPLSHDYVRKIFGREMGVSPHEYLVLARIERARNMFDSGAGNKFSAFSISQIAEACGFSDQFYFSRVFKKFCGVSPSDYMSGKEKAPHDRDLG